ncbi:MAG: M23 family metallopeptidase [Cyanobacteriota bacterium]|nr:M23 family metallopeptidase [Cyanobacteriota bacterium]
MNSAHGYRLLLLGGLGLQSALASPGPALHRHSPPEQVPSQTQVADLLPAELAPKLALARSVTEPTQLRSLGLLYPLELPALQIDPWGWRWSESRSAWRMHTGIDLAADEGTAVLAARAGEVRLVESLGAYGLCVLIDHGQGLETLYAHLLDAEVTPGDQVEAGAVIARVGSSGSATGPHLHFELRLRSGEITALNPTPHLPPLLLPPPLPDSVITLNP